MTTYIKDLQTGKVREYGTNPHDSLVISEDGRTLSYYNLQNGDGSRYGDYRFCDEDGNIPEGKDECGEDYFNIGGWEEPKEEVKYVVKNFTKEDLAEPQEDIWTYVEEIAVRAKETEEDFIFETIKPFVLGSTTYIISKKILGNALEEYFNNHPEMQRIRNCADTAESEEV